MSHHQVSCLKNTGYQLLRTLAVPPPKKQLKSCSHRSGRCIKLLWGLWRLPSDYLDAHSRCSVTGKTEKCPVRRFWLHCEEDLSIPWPYSALWVVEPPREGPGCIYMPWPSALSLFFRHLCALKTHLCLFKWPIWTLSCETYSRESVLAGSLDLIFRDHFQVLQLCNSVIYYRYYYPLVSTLPPPAHVLSENILHIDCIWSLKIYKGCTASHQGGVFSAPCCVHILHAWKLV